MHGMKVKAVKLLLLYSGIEVIIPNGTKIRTSVILLPCINYCDKSELLGIFDLKAKAPIQYFIGDNGYYGCSFCEQKGEHLGKHFYPYNSTQSSTIRTKQSVKNSCQQMRISPELDQESYFYCIYNVISIME
jgi:hypothetical protein